LSRKKGWGRGIMVDERGGGGRRGGSRTGKESLGAFQLSFLFFLPRNTKKKVIIFK
jgi:hypothetical protein